MSKMSLRNVKQSGGCPEWDRKYFRTNRRHGKKRSLSNQYHPQSNRKLLKYWRISWKMKRTATQCQVNTSSKTTGNLESYSPHPQNPPIRHHPAAISPFTNSRLISSPHLLRHDLLVIPYLLSPTLQFLKHQLNQQPIFEPALA